jgi:hypothetical protein
MILNYAGCNSEFGSEVALGHAFISNHMNLKFCFCGPNFLAGILRGLAEPCGLAAGTCGDLRACCGELQCLGGMLRGLAVPERAWLVMAKMAHIVQHSTNILFSLKYITILIHLNLTN